MLFPSTQLAARIERAECRLITDGTVAASARHPDAEVLVIPAAGGVATYATAGSPLNKLAGLGFGGPLEEAELEAIERAFARRGSPLQVELSSLAEPGIGKLLTRRGYELQGFENVLGRELPLADTARPAGDVAISLDGPEGLATWIDVVVSAFAAPDVQGVSSHESFPREVVERVMGDMAAADGFRRYLAEREGEPAGGASMRLFEGVAQLCGAATLPAHRRRGVQGALLARRLADATEEGCDVAIVTTLPGSKSHENGHRKGFGLLYTRAILVREG